MRTWPVVVVNDPPLIGPVRSSPTFPPAMYEPCEPRSTAPLTTAGVLLLPLSNHPSAPFHESPDALSRKIASLTVCPLVISSRPLPVTLVEPTADPSAVAPLTTYCPSRIV